MRWSFSRPALRLLSVSVAAATAAGCVTTTTRAFLPSPQNPIYTVEQAEPVLTEYLRLQCEPLRKAQRPDFGTARFVVEVDSLGFATRAELQRSTSDETLDGVFGTIAAQLTFDRTGKARRERLDLRYHCDGSDARVTLVVAPPNP